MPTLNYAKETTTTTGTGTYSLGGAVSPFASFVARATDDVGGTSPWSNIFYVVTDNAGVFEFGEGTLTDAGTDTLTRAVIHASSNGGARVYKRLRNNNANAVAGRIDTDDRRGFCHN
jgi:hypothetical protein